MGAKSSKVGMRSASLTEGGGRDGGARGRAAPSLGVLIANAGRAGPPEPDILRRASARGKPLGVKRSIFSALVRSTETSLEDEGLEETCVLDARGGATDGTDMLDKGSQLR